MQNGIHAHYFGGSTSLVLDHTHQYSGETSREPEYDGHFHYLAGYTTVDHGHTHYYQLLSGPNFQVANGHTHYYVGYTTTEQQHFHYLQGYTGVNDYYQEAKKRFGHEEAQQIGKLLGIDFSKYDVEQFRMGLDVELEHGLINPHTNITNDDPIITGKISLAHLNELSDYYTRLSKMEQEVAEE